MMNIIKGARVFALVTAVTAMTFAGCREGRGVSRPIGPHLMGRWVLTASMPAGDRAYKERFYKDGSTRTDYYYVFRDDSTLINVRTLPYNDECQSLKRMTWRADEDKGGFWLDSTFVPLMELTDDRMVFGRDSIFTDECVMMAGDYHFLMRRVPDEPSPAEKLVGKWVYTESYRQKVHEWEKVEYPIVVDFSVDLKDNGICDYYLTDLADTFSFPCSWMFCISENILLLREIDASWEIEQFEDDTMYIGDKSLTDIETGKTETGHFRIKMVREKKTN